MKRRKSPKRRKSREHLKCRKHRKFTKLRKSRKHLKYRKRRKYRKLLKLRRLRRHPQRLPLRSCQVCSLIKASGSTEISSNTRRRSNSTVISSNIRRRSKDRPPDSKTLLRDMYSREICSPCRYVSLRSELHVSILNRDFRSQWHCFSHSAYLWMPHLCYCNFTVC